MDAHMDTPKIEELKGNFLGRLYINKHFPEFYNFLISKYKHIPYKKFSELLYLYYHNMDDRPECKCCNNKVDFISFTEGYRIYCSTKCQTNDPITIKKALNTKRKKYGEDINNSKKMIQTKLERYGDSHYNNMEKNKQTCLKKYGVEHYTNRNKAKKTCLERYGVEYALQNKELYQKHLNTKKERYGEDNVSNQEKTKQTCLERYGVENTSLLPEIINKIEKTKLQRYGNPYYSNRDKAKQTCLERYGVDNYSSTKECRDKVNNTNIERYGVDNIAKLDACKQKIYNTKKEHSTFNTSAIEEEFALWLTEHNISFKRQYRSEDYPFSCDFYFPDKDLYLEIQGMWTHGGHPYDPNNEDDIKTLKLWRGKNTDFYNNAIDVWSIKDPQKRQWAKEHNLNWEEVFTNDLNTLIPMFINPVSPII